MNSFLSHRQYYLPRRVSSSGFPVPTPGRREDRKALRGCQVDVCVFLTFFFNDSFAISDYGVLGSAVCNRFISRSTLDFSFSVNF